MIAKDVMKRMIGIIILLALTSPKAFPQAQPKPAQGDQEDSVTLRSLLVDVRAVVTDKAGHIVTNLTKDDFELLENDKPQQVAFFSEERIAAPPRSTTPTAVAPRTESSLAATVRSNEPPARTIVFFLDTFHLPPADLERTKQALRRFISEQMTERDLLAIVATDGRLGLLSQLTQDRHILQLAIDQLSVDPRGLRQTLLTPYIAAMAAHRQQDATAMATRILRAESGSLGEQSEATQSGRLINKTADAQTEQRVDSLLAEETARRRVILETFKSLAARLAELPGQRIVAMFSNGFSLFGQFGTKETDELKAAISRAARNGVVVYTLVPEGLQGSASGRADYPIGFTPDNEYVRFDTLSRADAKDALNALAAETGGKLLDNANDLNRSLQQVLDDNQIYYRLAYYPADATSKEFRRLALRVRNHPDYVVRTQRGYAASDIEKPRRETDPAKRLFAALAEPLPYRGLDVSVTADYLERAADDAQVTLQIDLDASHLEYKSEGGHQALNVELAIGIYNLKSEPVDTAFDKARIDARPESIELLKQNGFRYTKRIKLKPGTYQIRVGVREDIAERIGTATAWLEVPNITHGELQTSSLILSQRAKESAAPLRPRAIGGIRFYKAALPLVYYLRAYNVGEKAEALLMQTELRQGDKRIGRSDWEPLAGYMLGKDAKGVELSGSVNLNGLSAGLYELRITIRNAQTNRTAQQAMVFGIMP